MGQVSGSLFAGRRRRYFVWGTESIGSAMPWWVATAVAVLRVEDDLGNTSLRVPEDPDDLYDEWRAGGVIRRPPPAHMSLLTGHFINATMLSTPSTVHKVGVWRSSDWGSDRCLGLCVRTHQNHFSSWGLERYLGYLGLISQM